MILTIFNFFLIFQNFWFATVSVSQEIQHVTHGLQEIMVLILVFEGHMEKTLLYSSNHEQKIRDMDCHCLSCVIFFKFNIFISIFDL